MSTYLKLLDELRTLIYTIPNIDQQRRAFQICNDLSVFTSVDPSVYRDKESARLDKALSAITDTTKKTADFIEPNGWVIYADGSCRKNNIGAYAFTAVYNHTIVHEHGKRVIDEDVTNNKMELESAIAALDFLLDNTTDDEYIHVICDAEYVVKGITLWLPNWKKNKWVSSTGKAVANQTLWKRLDRLVSAFRGKVTFTWVRGHDGTPGNERVDTIAQALSFGKDISFFHDDSFFLSRSDQCLASL